MHNEELLKIAHRLVTDEEYRTWFLTSPKQVLVAELGVSPQVLEYLMAVVPTVCLGSAAAILASGGEPIEVGGWNRG